MKGQRRGERIAITDDERDAFLSAERTCRVATVGVAPHFGVVAESSTRVLYRVVETGVTAGAMKSSSEVLKDMGERGPTGNLVCLTT